MGPDGVPSAVPIMAHRRRHGTAAAPNRRPQSVGRWACASGRRGARMPRRAARRRPPGHRRRAGPDDGAAPVGGKPRARGDGFGGLAARRRAGARVPAARRSGPARRTIDPIAFYRPACGGAALSEGEEANLVCACSGAPRAPKGPDRLQRPAHSSGRPDTSTTRRAAAPFAPQGTPSCHPPRGPAGAGQQQASPRRTRKVGVRSRSRIGAARGRGRRSPGLRAPEGGCAGSGARAGPARGPPMRGRAGHDQCVPCASRRARPAAVTGRRGSQRNNRGRRLRPPTPRCGPA
jgi:hypothetical protein